MSTATPPAAVEDHPPPPPVQVEIQKGHFRDTFPQTPISFTSEGLDVFYI